MCRGRCKPVITGWQGCHSVAVGTTACWTLLLCMLQVQEVAVQALPGLSAHAGHAWDPGMLLAFGEAVLVWIQQQASSRPNQQLQVSYSASSKSISCEVVEDGDMPGRLQGLMDTD